MGMSAATALHPTYYYENKCKCGHEYVQHAPAGTFTLAGTPTTGQTISVTIAGITVVTNQTTGQTLLQLAQQIGLNIIASGLFQGNNAIIGQLLASGSSLNFWGQDNNPPVIVYSGSSSGGATVSPTSPTNSTPTCLICPTPATIPHIHAMTGLYETEPSVWFQTNPRRGYYTSGGLGTYLPNATSLASLVAVGATTATVVLATGAVVGGTIRFIPASQQNIEEFEIVGISGSLITFTPPTTISYSATTPVAFLGRAGSMMGSGLPPNGQRAG